MLEMFPPRFSFNVFLNVVYCWTMNCSQDHIVLFVPATVLVPELGSPFPAIIMSDWSLEKCILLTNYLPSNICFITKAWQRVVFPIFRSWISKSGRSLFDNTEHDTSDGVAATQKPTVITAGPSGECSFLCENIQVRCCITGWYMMIWWHGYNDLYTAQSSAPYRLHIKSVNISSSSCSSFPQPAPGITVVWWSDIRIFLIVADI